MAQHKSRVYVRDGEHRAMTIAFRDNTVIFRQNLKQNNTGSANKSSRRNKVAGSDEKQLFSSREFTARAYTIVSIPECIIIFC
jgi:hypothetical protein